MIRSTILTGIITLAIFLLAGCSGHDHNNNPADPSSKDIFSLKIGTNTIEKNKANIIALGKESTMTFQFLKNMDSATFNTSMVAKIELVNATTGNGYLFTNTDIVNNGIISISNNDFGGVVTYSSSHPLDYVAAPGGGFSASPGDKIMVYVDYLGTKFTDGSQTFLRDDQLTIYNSADVFQRQVGTDDLDTGGVIQSIKLGDFTLTDKDVNLIPLDNVQEINVDFAPQLNPYKFKDLLDFRIVINNMFSNTSYIVERASLDENGDLYVIDYARGIVKYRLNHSMRTVLINGIEFTPASPGDLIEIRIDYFNDEDVQENPLKWQNKRFRIFYIS